MERKYLDRNGTKITAAQFITELFLIRRAAISSKILPIKFWDLPQYRKQYQLNIILVSRFLHLYHEDDVVKSLLSVEGSKFCSTKNPKLIKIIEKNQMERENLSKKASPSYTTTDGQMRPTTHHNIIFDLRNLENG